MKPTTYSALSRRKHGVVLPPKWDGDPDDRIVDILAGVESAPAA